MVAATVWQNEPGIRRDAQRRAQWAAANSQAWYGIGVALAGALCALSLKRAAAISIAELWIKHEPSTVPSKANARRAPSISLSDPPPEQ